MVKNLSAKQKPGLILGWEDTLEKVMATHSICAEEFHGQRSRQATVPGVSELDMTEPYRSCFLPFRIIQLVFFGLCITKKLAYKKLFKLTESTSCFGIS